MDKFEHLLESTNSIGEGPSIEAQVGRELGRRVIVPRGIFGRTPNISRTSLEPLGIIHKVYIWNFSERNTIFIFWEPCNSSIIFLFDQQQIIRTSPLRDNSKAGIPILFRSKTSRSTEVFQPTRISRNFLRHPNCYRGDNNSNKPTG